MILLFTLIGSSFVTAGDKEVDEIHDHCLAMADELELIGNEKTEYTKDCIKEMMEQEAKEADEEVEGETSS